MKAKGVILTFLIFFFIACEKEDGPPATTDTEYTFDFSSDAEGWTGDFADYPVGEEDFYELDFTYTTLPEPLDVTEGALKLSGNNHSDDLFMFTKKEILGLVPNQEYTINFTVEFAANVADGQFGIGGSPGESVYIKVGATPIEPGKELDADGFYRMNIDKNNQSQDGNDMVVIGNFANGTNENMYTLKSISNPSPFNTTANNQGTLWVIVGTDSGFEGATTIYFDKIEIAIL